jgi:hypothetical protein
VEHIDAGTFSGHIWVTHGTGILFEQRNARKDTKKNSWEAALTARMRRIPHEFFSCQFVSFVVKKRSPGFIDALHSRQFCSDQTFGFDFRLFADLFAQVVKLRPADTAFADDFEAGNTR